MLPLVVFDTISTIEFPVFEARCHVSFLINVHFLIHVLPVILLDKSTFPFFFFGETIILTNYFCNSEKIVHGFICVCWQQWRMHCMKCQNHFYHWVVQDSLSESWLCSVLENLKRKLNPIDSGMLLNCYCSSYATSFI